ncbi:uncharacterized protein BYT42DRAFT_561941 [Radiomyces spectabilis]|uniref:uncharacterized protein n=1 Tax=Radiomyces spectabilis TaxID=64574 RepID=UPI00221F319E|nr:uncharacterized protein BYT42DRAFT_561941 [Radiomyces spectabilis]KAI8384268.1 hypothetical protein BYT42DRAFT_561941 [Radiomyces spectabilis]
MRKSSIHLREAATLLFPSTPKGTSSTNIPSCCWNSHLRALMNAVDSSSSTSARPLTGKQIPYRRAHAPLHRWTTKPPRAVKVRSLSTAAALENPSYSPQPLERIRTPRPMTEPPPSLHGPLAIFNLSNSVTLADLETAIQLQQAEKAWALFSTLTSRNDDNVNYIPLALCSSLYTLLIYAKNLASFAKAPHPFELRQSQSDQLVDYVETAFGLSKDQFLASVEVLPLEPQALLQHAIRIKNHQQAWSCYLHMVQENCAADIPRYLYLRLMNLLRGDDTLSASELSDRLTFVAQQHAHIKDTNGRSLRTNAILLISKLCYALRRNDQQIIRDVIDTALKVNYCTLDAYDEIFWQLLRCRQTTTAYNMLERLHQDGKAQNGQVYTNFINAYRRQNKYMDAVGIFQKMLEMGVNPDIKTFNALLQLSAEQGDVVKTVRIFESMIEHSILPDIASYAEMIKANAKRGFFRICAQYYDMMQQQNIQPNIYIYNIIIQAYADRRDVHSVIEWFKRMLDNDVRPNEYVISCVLNAFAKRHCYSHRDTLEVVARIVQQAMGAGIKADAVLYSMLLKIQAASIGPTAAFSLHKEMIERCIQPNSYTYTSLIDLYGRHNMPETAQQIFDLMKTSTRFAPNTVTYCALIEAWVKSRHRDKASMLIQEFIRRSKSDKSGRLWIDAALLEYIRSFA